MPCLKGCGFVAENGGVGWRCYMECGIFVATLFGMCWRFGREGDLLAGSAAGGYEGQPLKAGGAAQPGATLPALCL